MTDKDRTVLRDIKKNIAMAQFSTFGYTRCSTGILQNDRIFLMLYRRLEIDRFDLINRLFKVKKPFIWIFCSLTRNCHGLILNKIHRMR